MLTPEQVRKAADMLGEDATPEQIAQEFNMSRSAFLGHLQDSGYRVRVRRELERIVPVPLEPREMSAVA
jgi:AraC-like DNA-binding protein